MENFNSAHEDFLDTETALPEPIRFWPDATYGAARPAGESDLHGILSPVDRGDGIALEGFAPIVHDPQAPRTWRALYSRQLGLKNQLLNRHLLAVAPTGSGKTTSVVLPILEAAIRDPERSVIIFDCKRESTGLLKLAEKLGKKLVVLNIGDPERSIGWNPVGASADLDRLGRVAFALCHAVETNSSTNQESKFWINNAVDLLTGILHALARENRAGVSIARARDVLRLPRKKLRAWLADHAEGIQELANFDDYLSTGSHNAETILADTQSRLSAYRLESIATVTSSDELRLQSIVDEPTVFVVEMDEDKVQDFRPTWNLLLEALLDSFVEARACSSRGTLPRPVSLIIDEFASSVGRIPNAEIRFNTLRSRGVSITAAVQSLGQIKWTYGSAAPSVLAAFCSKIFLSGLDADDAAYASRLSGTATIEETTLSDTGSDDERTSRLRRPVSRPLFLTDEIARPRPHFWLGRAATCFLADTPPFQAWLLPSFRNERLAEIVHARNDEIIVDPHRRNKALVTTPSRKDSGEFPNGIHSVAKAYAKIRKFELGLKQASPEVVDYWHALERAFKKEPKKLLELANSIVHRQSSASEFYVAQMHSDAPNVEAALHYLDYLRSSGEMNRSARSLRIDRTIDEPGTRSTTKESATSGAASEGTEDEAD